MSTQIHQSARTSELAIVVVTIIVSLAGCGGRVLEVTRAKPPASPTQSLGDCKVAQDHPCNLPGVPFYAVDYRCLHTTVWLQPVYTVTLAVTGSDGKYVPPVTKFFGRKEFDDSNTQAVLMGVKAVSQSSIDDYRSIVDAFIGLQGINPLTFDTAKILEKGSQESLEAMLVSNSVAPERYVDANAVLYLNVKKPLNGPASAEIDLNNEGILSKASGQVEDKTLATVLSALPISDLIKGAAGLSTTGVELLPTPQGAPVKYKVDLQIQTKIYKHTHSKVDTTAKSPCPVVATLVGADGSKDYNFTVEDATAPVNPPSPPKPAATADKPKDGG